MPPEGMEMWAWRYRKLGIDDDNDDDDDVDKCCARDEPSEYVEEDDFAVEHPRPKQQGGDHWLQGKKRLKEVIRKLEQQLE